MKTCSRCGKNKQLDEFPINGKTHSSWCRQCHTDYKREWRSKNRDKVRTYKERWRSKHRAYYNSRNKIHQARYRAANQVKCTVRQNAKKALQNGDIVRKPCMVCGSEHSTMHHWSYDPKHATDVFWLCHKCHTELHEAMDGTCIENPTRKETKAIITEMRKCYKYYFSKKRSKKNENN
jgi:hypothetical protein